MTITRVWSIREADGKVLLHCHAGCSQRDVIAALKARGLWESSQHATMRRRIVATYDYTDEHGELSIRPSGTSRRTSVSGARASTVNGSGRKGRDRCSIACLKS